VLKGRGRALLVVALAAAFLAAYAGGVEPFWIEVTRHHVAAPVEPPLKIAHLSDLHTNGLGRRERILLDLLERERPDVIVITGDSLIDGIALGRHRAGRDEAVYARAGELLRRLRAPLGVWAVRGNWEDIRPIRGEKAFYQGLGLRLLVNDAEELRPGVWLAGTDDLQGAPDVDAALRSIPEGSFAIALFHSPALFDRVAGRCPLALAGHTHGGQIRLPFLPPVWLPWGTGRYVEGWYEQKGSRLYVSRGIGTSVLPLRFLARPELALITLGP
jgi:hypothetical protein